MKGICCVKFRINMEGSLKKQKEVPVGKEEEGSRRQEGLYLTQGR